VIYRTYRTYPLDRCGKSTDTYRIMNLVDQLLKVSDAYANARRLSLSTVSTRVLGDGKRLPALVNGADISVRRFEQAMQWFSDNWPDDGRWPAAVQRPKPKRRRAAQATAAA
jgi:hypothetical protein